MLWKPTHAHNAGLQMLVNGGWPAATAFVGSVLAYAVAVRRLPSSSRDGVVLAIAMIGVTEHLVREPSVPLLALAVAFGSIGARRSAMRDLGPPTRGERHDLVGVSN
jgi:O-antigen ligase